MIKFSKILSLLIISGLTSIAGVCWADETDIFSSPPPDLLFELDISGSMNMIPAGWIWYIDKSLPTSNCTADSSVFNGPFYPQPDAVHSTKCYSDYSHVPRYGDPSCLGPYYQTDSVTGYKTNCSKYAIAKRTIFSLLDVDGNGVINSADEAAMKVRIGFMRFYLASRSVDETNGIYNPAKGNGCNYIIKEIGAKYSSIYCNSDTQCLITDSCSSTDDCANFNNWADGNTPDADALVEVKMYLDANKSSDPAGACRKKYAILITDGCDTLACVNAPGSLGGAGLDYSAQIYVRLRQTVAKAKALGDAGYKVFVVGFGANAPYFLVNTLNWAAYFGGTDNPLVDNSGNIAGYNPSTVPDCKFYGDTLDDAATGLTTPGPGVACKDTITGLPCKSSIGITDTTGCHCYVLANDPGEATLNGYAFVATNPPELLAALKTAINVIREGYYSFSGSSVSSSRASDDNYIYDASFLPNANDPLWQGHLKKYSLNTDGSVGSMVWDAGLTLKTKNPSTRNLISYRSGSVYNLASDAPGQLKTYLDVQTGTAATLIANYMKGVSFNNPDNWKLGDSFHSNAVVIGSPSIYYADQRSPAAFSTFRSNHASRDKLLMVGANDGQLHAFMASSANGDEKWSFIPPNLQAKLKYLAHFSHPTAQNHMYFVDGPITAADVWLGSGDGTGKSADDWHTLLIFGEGRGVRDSTNSTSSFLWSSADSCDLNFNASYTGTYNKYCGYHALDTTHTSDTNPTYQWHINLTDGANQGPYLGEPWSKMNIGRVRINGNEKWVGFIGGGYNETAGATPGRGFFVVDLSNGNILWDYTQGDNSAMTYSIPAAPAAVDSDNDGFIDTAYVGDLGGNIWRFNFCSNADVATCNTSNWSGGKLFDSSVGTGMARPIYITPAVSKDTGALWVFWGTGDKQSPTAKTAVDHFFALKDPDHSTTRNITSDFQDISTAGTTYNGTTAGWYITLGGTGEKVLYDPNVFGGIALFTTYIPPTGTDPCDPSGTSKLYAIAMMRVKIGTSVYDPGAGVLSAPGTPTSTAGGARSVALGYGIAKTPTLSQKALPASGATDIYISLSGGSGVDATIVSGKSTALANTPLTTLLADTAASSQLMLWRDRRVQ